MSVATVQKYENLPFNSINNKPQVFCSFVVLDIQRLLKDTLILWFEINLMLYNELYAWKIATQKKILKKSKL